MKEGDVVQLKSGGPLMTITEIENETAWVTWFISEAERTSAAFPLTTLEKKEVNTTDLD